MLFTLASLIVTAQVAVGICYWPNGSVDTKGYECNTTSVDQGGHTSCCLHNDACYESGSCFQDWSGIMYRQSCTDPTWKDPSCPQYCLQKDQLQDAVWIQSCSLQDKMACCVTDAPSSGCCNDTSNTFTFTPGYIQAVINGDGTNRLSAYISADQSKPTASNSTTPADSGANPSVDASASTGAGAGDTAGLPTSVRNAIIAIGAILGTIILIALVSLMFVWRKYSQERRLRREDRETMGRQQKEIWPEHTHQATVQADTSGAVVAKSEMYAGEPKGAHWSSGTRELPTSHGVSELGT